MNSLFVRLARFGTVLALAVVMLGAWVRLHDAGLGCPDWPGCYGRLVVPDQATSAQDLGPQGAVRPLEAAKAWREMIHRYLAGTLVLVTLGLAALAWLNRADPAQPWRRPLALVAVIVFQALLGMWTVTLLLKPLIVVAHLFGGLATLALLASLGRWRSTRVGAPTPALRALGLAAAAALVLQIFLGGWTSSNYAALACPDFPRCQTQWWPALADYKDGFVLWRGLGQSYEGGVLDHPARVAIHFTHRLGAVVAFVLVVLLGWRVARDPATRADGLAVLALALLQVSLGVSIVLFGVPLPVAVAHNGVAALLLLSVINANQRIRQR
ncbi:MAG TPA: COX15/CtaA family protein [Gammaproteobacteria bacterium]|jgi:cytochrome c oxidase assembly protein subunit 15|nr:COX15/CtaA family protein [Gammaproteobacteria bacterium]